MSQKNKQRRSGGLPRFGKRAPRYNFILNPYVDARFTSCPKCNRKMGQRKVPLVIHVEPLNPIVLNKTCRYCTPCDLLIAHQDEIQALLAQLFPNRPMITPKDYLPLGTLDRADWKKSLKEPISIADLPEYMHDFKNVLEIKYTGGWVRRETPEP
jgi:hypothetical protein